MSIHVNMLHTTDKMHSSIARGSKSEYAIFVCYHNRIAVDEVSEFDEVDQYQAGDICIGHCTGEY